MKIPLKIKFIEGECGTPPKMPAYATPGSAAFDLCAHIAGDYTISPGGRALIPTGIAVEIPSPEYVGYVFARSGLAIKSGICLSNGVGVIDSDYRGEIKVGLTNLSDSPYLICPGDRIAQFAIMNVIQAEFEVAGDLSDSARSAGGFGSTGR